MVGHLKSVIPLWDMTNPEPAVFIGYSMSNSFIHTRTLYLEQGVNNRTAEGDNPANRANDEWVIDLVYDVLGW